MRNLNGWQRLSVLACVLWLPLGFFWGSAWWVQQAGAPVVAQLRLCASDINNPDIPKCYSDFGPRYTEAVGGHWWAAVAGALLPIALVWAAIRIGHWVTKGGFR